MLEQFGGGNGELKAAMQYYRETRGLSDISPEGTPRTMDGLKELDQRMSELRSTEINATAARGEAQWSTYSDDSGNGFIR